MIAAAVDDGTRTITKAFSRELRHASELLITKSIREMSLRDWIKLRAEIRDVTHSADTVLCLNHGALIAGSLFLRRGDHIRKIAICDWTRQFPSRRIDWRTRIYALVLRVLLKRYTAVYTPVAGMKAFYADQVAMQPIRYPLPYPDVDPSSAQGASDSLIKALFIGADIKRKSGDILLDLWKESRPAGAKLTFVTPVTPLGDWPDVNFCNNIKAFTQEHRDILASHTIFILASQREAYGFAALEALNFGQVVVTTEAAGISDLVRAAGGIVAPTPKEAVTQALQLMNCSEELIRRQQLCKAYMSGYQETFTKLMDHALGRN